MMRQMPRTQPLLKRTGRFRKVNPIMNELVASKPRRNSTKKNHRRRRPKNPTRTDNHNSDRNPRPQRENRARIPMMHLMQSANERPMRMPEHAMDHVLKQRPRKQSGCKDNRVGKHNDSIVGR